MSWRASRPGGSFGCFTYGVTIAGKRRCQRARVSPVARRLLLVGCLATSAPLQAAIAQQIAGGRTAPVSGVVRDDVGIPVLGAAVTVNVDGSAPRTVRTGQDGHFQFSSVPLGGFVISVRRIGFGPWQQDVGRLDADGLEMEIALRPLARALPPVTVFQKAEVYDPRLEGFHSRVKAKAGGYFITRQRLERSTGWSLPDILREVPGVRVAPVNGIRKAVRLRGARCAPLVFVDGFPASAGEFDLEMLPVVTLEGVEVYPSMASIPPEFGSVRGSEGCGVVAVWSRPANGERPRVDDVAPVDLERLMADEPIYTADEVQEQARQDTASSPPVEYPDSLWQAGMSGRVVLELVVDVDGEVEPGTLRVVSATHRDFARAAVAAVAAAHFFPATIRGMAVRQLIQLPVVFVPGMEPTPDGG